MHIILRESNSFYCFLGLIPRDCRIPEGRRIGVRRTTNFLLLCGCFGILRMQKFRIGGGHMLMMGMLFLLASTRTTGRDSRQNPVSNCCPNYCGYVCSFSTVEEEEGVDPVNGEKKERVAPVHHQRHIPDCCPNDCHLICPFSTVEEKEGVDPVNDGKKERVVPRAHSGRPPT